MNTEQDELKIEDIEEEDSIAHVRYDIASYPSDLTLSVIKQMWENHSILIPEFQRNFVWSIRQASLLIDSFLCGLPVPPIFFYVDKNNVNLVIDGQQRILSIIYFFDGYFGKEDLQKRRQVFRLDLGKEHPYNGKTFEELQDSDRRKLENSSVLRAINIRQISPEDEGTSAYHIFERLNTGGTPLKPQEIRNCVFRGKFSELLKDLNCDDNWRKILGRPYHDKHQKDSELLLRVFALFAMRKIYEKPMKEFLNLAMRKYKHADADVVKIFAHRFPKITQLIVDNIGEKPFNLRGPLNTSALDSVMVTLIENINNIDSSLREKYNQLTRNDDFLSYTLTGTTDVATLKSRFNLAEKILIN